MRVFFLLMVVAAQQAHSGAQTGRQLTTFGIESEIEAVESADGFPFAVLPINRIFWDARCARVEYTFNTAAPANLGTEQEIAPEDLAKAVQKGMNRWNNNPSSYIDMQITRQENLGVRPRIAGDFINEVTFVTSSDFAAIASSPSSSLLEDTTLFPGDDLDFDGDSDVYDPEVEGLNECTDIDGDGDIEFPAGFYSAGTILDNDVQFSSNLLWELTPSNARRFDVQSVATHEFGHSHGLNHSPVNQLSNKKGRGVVMYPFSVNTLRGKRAGRTLTQDDLAASAFIYPEGSESSGPGALQKGDIAFDQAYDVIEGRVSSGGQSIIGASVQIHDDKTGEVLAQTYSGRGRLFVDIFDFNLNGFLGELFAFEESAGDGRYQVPVPTRRLVTASIEALDGDPVSPGNIGIEQIVGDFLGQTSFAEEGHDGSDESDIEFRPFARVRFYSKEQKAKSIDFELNRELVQQNFTTVDFPLAIEILDSERTVYAEVFERSELRELFAAGFVPIRSSFLTDTFENMDVPQFTAARLVLGRTTLDGRFEIVRELREQTMLIGQESDQTNFLLSNPKALPFSITNAFNADASLQLAVVVELETDTFDIFGLPRNFIPFELRDSGTSFLSTNGGPLQRFSGTWSISMSYVNDGQSVNPYLVSSAVESSSP